MKKTNRTRKLPNTSIILYHGTTARKAEQIKKLGFTSNTKHNWNIKSKPGFIYLSTAYAPFYASTNNGNPNRLALIKVRVNKKDCYPDDDFLMHIANKPKYTQEELDSIKLEDYKNLWMDSLRYMGSIAIKPSKAIILGIRIFNRKNLFLKCDPTITPMNFKIMGNYYKRLTKWIYAGKEISEFESFTHI